MERLMVTPSGAKISLRVLRAFTATCEQHVTSKEIRKTTEDLEKKRENTKKKEDKRQRVGDVDTVRGTVATCASLSRIAE